MSEGNLTTANDLKKEILKLQKEIEDLSIFTEMKGLTKRLRFDTRLATTTPVHIDSTVPVIVVTTDIGNATLQGCRLG